MDLERDAARDRFLWRKGDVTIVKRSARADVTESSADALAEFLRRIESKYLPAFVRGTKHEATYAFDRTKIVTPPDTAAGFLRAIDEGVVEERNRSFGLPKDFSGCHGTLFDWDRQLPGRVLFMTEGPIDIAAAGRLALDLGWPRERLGFRSAMGEVFDITAYGPQDDEMTRDALVIAGETKGTQGEADRLVEDVRSCGASGWHKRGECPLVVRKRPNAKNHHRKYKGLLQLRPSLFWVLGPKREHVLRVVDFGSGRISLLDEPVAALRLGDERQLRMR